MGRFNRGLLGAAALLALGACESIPMMGDPPSSAGVATPATPAPKSVVEAAIDAAGGEAAQRKVKEVAWTGAATVTAEGKTTEIEVDTIVRPFTWARTTSWPKGDKKAARTVQAEQGKAWDVNRMSWSPMAEPQATHEVLQYALYGFLLPVTLKDPGAQVSPQPDGSDGTRAVKVQRPGAAPTELEYDASGRLLRAGFVVPNPKAGGPDIVQQVEFSGEMVSNGVKWPKRILIKQNGQPWFDLTLATFEARETHKVQPISHTLDEDDTPPPPRGGPGGRPG